MVTTPTLKSRPCHSCGAKIFWARNPAGATRAFDLEPAVFGAYVVGAWDVKVPGVPPFLQMTLFEMVEDRGERRYELHSCPHR